MKFDSVVTLSVSNIKYGVGATQEVGHDIQQLDCKRVMVVTDSNVAQLEPIQITLDSLKQSGVESVLYPDVKIEPTDQSFQHAIDFAVDGQFDGFVAVGGGSSIDTAKIANLYSTYPDDFLAYVNKPIGQGKPLPNKVKPLIAIPTTAGTGSETTGVAIFDYLEMNVKTGISHAYLRPNLGIIDPNNTKDLHPMVIACCGLDVFCHAIESLTAIHYTKRPKPDTPHQRPPYQGANPISDVWSGKAIELIAQNILPAMQDANNHEARANMLLASTYAGIGFGNAGVHLPHAMSYPVGSIVRDYIPVGYPDDKPLIPHGMSVILNAPAVFRFTASANPKAHLEAIRLMGIDTRNSSTYDIGNVLADGIINLMQKTDMPNGLKAVGFDEIDIDRFVEGTLAQERLTKLTPRQPNREELAQLFVESMVLW